MNPLAEYLEDDHARLDALLTKAVAGASFDVDAYEAFRAALLRHMAIEEKVLLADARARRGGVPLPDARRLRIEHAALAMLTLPTPDRRLVGEIRQILLEHIGVEEGPGGAFAQHASLALPDELAALAARARAYPPVRLRPHVNLDDGVRTAAAALAKAERAVDEEARSAATVPTPASSPAR